MKEVQLSELNSKLSSSQLVFEKGDSHWILTSTIGSLASLNKVAENQTLTCAQTSPQLDHDQRNLELHPNLDKDRAAAQNGTSARQCQVMPFSLPL